MLDPDTLAIDSNNLLQTTGLDGHERRRASLVVYSGNEIGRQLMLDEGLCTLGRSQAAQVQLEGAGLSRVHAELRVVGNSATLRDLGSANGSHVQDRRIGPEPVQLREGDMVRLGSVLLKFYAQRSLDALIYDRVYRLATVDMGTGVFNRRYLDEALRRELRLVRQAGTALALVGYDLDHFKQVNDAHGHAAGDSVLRDSAALVQAVLGSDGLLARVGGEEFCVLLPGCTLERARAIAERLRAAVAQHVFLLPTLLPASTDLEKTAVQRPLPHQQTLSLGVAAWREGMLDADDLMDAADRRLYQAKREGRNRVCG